MSAAIAIGTGAQKFLFKAGVLGMLHVEVDADTLDEACRYISSGDCIRDFPPALQDEMMGEEFRFAGRIA